VHLNPKDPLDIDYKKYYYSCYRTILSLKATHLWRDEIIELFEDKNNFICCHDFKNEVLSEKQKFE